MFDVESVELLGGQQGLLFGRNITGGTVVLRTARLDGEFVFKARNRPSTGLYKLSRPPSKGGLTNTLAGKLTVYYNDDDGDWKIPKIPFRRTEFRVQVVLVWWTLPIPHQNPTPSRPVVVILANAPI